MSTNLNEPEDAGIEDLRQDEERQPRRDNVREEEALGLPDDPMEEDPGDADADPSRIGGDPAEDDS